ncbi:MAG TPA: DUF6538 domain-containing protein, partial [Pseudolabrys sp.]|nr:DUF6538 domain-containing protein [Pseudolabrys sp.]
MACALGTPKRRPESGIYWFRKRVPDRLKAKVGKSEIKFSLRTRDPDVARLRNLEVMLEIERAWAGYTGVDLVTGAAAHIRCKPSGPPRSETRASEQVLLEAVAEAVPVTLRASFESYAQEAELAPATVKRWSPVIDRLVEHLGHDDARRIARTDIVAWKDALLKEGKASRTVRDVYLASVRATLQYAVDQGHLPENPAERVKVRVKKSLHEREKGFDHEEARTILAATLRAASERTSVEMAAARRWVPWLCAYSGARVNEITCLSG